MPFSLLSRPKRSDIATVGVNSCQSGLVRNTALRCSAIDRQSDFACTAIVAGYRAAGGPFGSPSNVRAGPINPPISN